MGKLGTLNETVGLQLLVGDSPRSSLVINLCDGEAVLQRLDYDWGCTVIGVYSLVQTHFELGFQQA